jgi:hypothetical protein
MEDTPATQAMMTFSPRMAVLQPEIGLSSERHHDHHRGWQAHQQASCYRDSTARAAAERAHTRDERILMLDFASAQAQANEVDLLANCEGGLG